MLLRVSLLVAKNTAVLLLQSQSRLLELTAVILAVAILAVAILAVVTLVVATLVVVTLVAVIPEVVTLVAAIPEEIISVMAITVESISSAMGTSAVATTSIVIIVEANTCRKLAVKVLGLHQ